jgi:hypothetical protein
MRRLLSENETRLYPWLRNVSVRSVFLPLFLLFVQYIHLNNVVASLTFGPAMMVLVAGSSLEVLLFARAHRKNRISRTVRSRRSTGRRLGGLVPIRHPAVDIE